VTEPGDVTYLNARINTALEKDIDIIGKWRPDILNVGKDKKVKFIEVVSPSQDQSDIYEKAEHMYEILKENGYKASYRVYTENGKLLKIL